MIYAVYYIGGEHSRVRTNDMYPVLFSYFYCTGMESSLKTCPEGIDYISLKDCSSDAVHLTCEGDIYYTIIVCVLSYPRINLSQLPLQ